MQTVNDKKQHSHKRFFLLLSALLLLIAVRYSLQIDIPRVVFLFVIVLICLLGDKSEIIAMCMCCIPLHESVDLFYSVVFCNAIYVIKYFKSFRVSANITIIFVMVFWELLHCMLQDFSIMNLLSSIIPLIVLAIMMCSEFSDLDFAFIVRAFALTTLVVFVILLLKLLFLYDFNVVQAIARLWRLGVDTNEAAQEVSVSGGEINPNTLGVIAVLAVTGLLQLRSNRQESKLDLVVVCTLMVFGALTASRTYLACLAFMFMLFLFCRDGNYVQKLKFFFIMIALIVAAFVILSVVFPDLLTYFVGRFFVEDITTGRDGLFVAYHEFIASNPRVLLWGIGLQDFGTRLIKDLWVATNVPHNSIQELIIAWGIPGIFMFAALIWSMHSSAGRFCRKQRLINWIPLLILLFKGMAGQMLNSSYTMIAFSWAYLSMVQNFGDDRVQN